MGNVYSLYNPAEETKSKEETGPSDLKLPVNQKADETEPVKKTGISDSKLDHEVEATACKEKSVTPVYKSVNNAVEQVKKGLHSVKVRHPPPPHTQSFSVYFSNMSEGPAKITNTSCIL